MSEGSLVASPQDMTAWHTGMGPIDTLMQTGDALGSGEWVEAGLMGVATGLETLGAIADPLGALFSAGVGFLIEHLEPLKGWLDELAGDPSQIQAFAETWHNVSAHIAGVSDDFVSMVASATADWDGVAIDAYRASARVQAGFVEAMGQMVKGVAAAVETSGAIVAGVRELVRDAISQLVGYGLSKTAQLLSGVFTLKAIGEIAAKVAEWAARIGTFVKALLKSMGNLGRHLDDLVTAADDAGTSIKRLADKWSATNVANGRYDFDRIFDGSAVRGDGLPSLANVTYTVGSGAGKHAADDDG